MKALIAVGKGVSLGEAVAGEAEERMRRQRAEIELEKLKKKLVRNPDYKRESLDRALALAGESPAETLVKLLHEKDARGQYSLEPSERVSIAKALLPYTVPAFKAQETKKEGDVGVTVVVQNFQKPEPKKAEVIDA